MAQQSPSLQTRKEHPADGRVCPMSDFNRTYHAPNGRQYVFMLHGDDTSEEVRVRMTTSFGGHLHEVMLRGFEGMSRLQALRHIEDNAAVLAA